MDQGQAELVLLLGRLEGKVDTLVSLQTSQGERLTNVENRVSAVETKVTIIESKQSTNSSWWATIGAAVVAVLSAAASLFGGYFNHG